MENGSKNKALVSIIAILLLTNISMLVFILRHKEEPPHQDTKKPGLTERIKKEVMFDSTQMAAFESRKKAHWDRMRVIFDTMTATKERFYYLTYNPQTPDSYLDSQASIIGLQQKQIDLNMIRYFKDVRKICNKHQLPKYDSILPEMFKRMTEPPRKK